MSDLFSIRVSVLYRVVPGIVVQARVDGVEQSAHAGQVLVVSLRLLVSRCLRNILPKRGICAYPAAVLGVKVSCTIDFLTVIPPVQAKSFKKIFLQCRENADDSRLAAGIPVSPRARTASFSLFWGKLVLLMNPHIDILTVFHILRQPPRTGRAPSDGICGTPSPSAPPAHGCT